MPRSRRPGPSSRVRVREFKDATQHNHDDRLVTEEPLEIRLQWPGRPPERLSVTMRTPGHDFELAAGFLLAEGIIRDAGDLHTVAYCTDHTLLPEEEFNVVTVSLAGPPRRDPAGRYDGPGAGSSACGVCGKQTIDDVLHLHGAEEAATSASRRWTALRVAPEVIRALPELLRDAQRVFDSTGGVHAAGLFEADGRRLVVREDVGRHNAVDKVFGARLLGGDQVAVPLLCVSGRIGFELVQKAVVAGVGLIAAVGAPSSLAVRLAEESGLGVVGFVRGERFVTYTAFDRIGVC